MPGFTRIITCLLLLISCAGFSISQTYEKYDLNPNGPSGPKYLKVYNGKLYLYAADSNYTSGIWTSDGTRPGTTPWLSIAMTETFLDINGKLLFVADSFPYGSEFWITDGTFPGTQLVKDIHPWPNLGGSIENIHPFYGRYIFRARDDSSGMEPWVTDGTAAGTHRAGDIYTPGSNGSNPYNFGTYGGEAYFMANDGFQSNNVWKTDGTAAGTQMFLNGYGSLFTEYNGSLFFLRTDTAGDTEIWKSDGTVQGTQRFIEINPSGSCNVSEMFEYNGYLYFSSNSGLGAGLYKTDGSVAGTQLVKSVTASNYFVLNGLLYFGGSTFSAGGLWVTDGTNAGTVLVKSGVFPYPRTACLYNGKAFFFSPDSLTEKAIWATDGTTAGTVRISPPGAANSRPFQYIQNPNLTAFNGSLYWVADYDSLDTELWKFTDFPLGLAPEHLPGIRLHLYPNPARDRVVIGLENALDHDLSFSVFDLRGQELASGLVLVAGRQRLQLDIASWSPGIYFLRERSGNLNLKFVKM